MSESVVVTREDLAVIETGILSLKERAQAIVVKDQQGYMQACNLVLEGRSYIKDVKAKLGVGIDSAKRHLETLRNQLTGYTTPVEDIVRIAEQKAEAWKRAEREAAERERQRIQAEAAAEARRRADEERREAERIAKEQREQREKELEAQRKAGEIKAREAEKLRKQALADEQEANVLAAKQAKETAANVPTVNVLSAVPKVAGIKARVNWKFRIVDETKIPRIYCKPDEVAIGQTVRTIKDKAKIEALIPGVEAYSEDSI